MDCWSVLGAPQDADEREIKRSYARQLKRVRPDADAEGFQRLREAYERALQLARWRTTEAVGEVQQPAADNLRQWSTLVELAPSPLPSHEPMPVLAPVLRSLQYGLDADNLPQRWRQAQEQDCTEPFLKHLLAICCDAPGRHLALIEWAVANLDWLTPWQRPSMTALQEGVLVQGLLQQYRRVLEELLAAGRERPFLERLGGYCAQPWLQIFDHRQSWQGEVLELLHQQSWQAPVFEGVCQLFGWDEKRGATPEPDWMWRALAERYQQEAFYQKLEADAANNADTTPQAAAARLFLTPPSRRRQVALARHFESEHWQACLELSHTLASRFPALVERLPHHDLLFWRSLVPRLLSVDNWIRCSLGSGLALGLYFMPKPGYSPELALMLGLVCSAMLGVLGILLLSNWQQLIGHLLLPDLWLTERLVPKRLNPRCYWLILRHGVPQLVMLALFGFWLGLLGMLGYLGFTLIGWLHSGRIGQANPRFHARHPWLGALHWNHFSPWQPVYLLLMVVLVRACQVHGLGFPLTRLIPG
ncbi:J domain-containing protein [Pseudomonas sp. KCJK8993]|uniref:J domain-containing protein n=1 Tax=Pseudomonas sp. KCJK8993 TaxID=3344565 RepID=UPI0039060F22